MLKKTYEYIVVLIRKHHTITEMTRIFKINFIKNVAASIDGFKSYV